MSHGYEQQPRTGARSVFRRRWTRAVAAGTVTLAVAGLVSACGSSSGGNGGGSATSAGSAGSAAGSSTSAASTSSSGGASSGGGSSAGGAMSGPSETLKLGMADSNTSPTYHFAQAFAANLKSATGGKLQVKVYPSEELGTTSAEITSVQSGSIAFIATPDLDAVVKDADVAILPYLFNSMPAAEKALNSTQMRTALWDKFSKYNLHVIGTWPIGSLGIMSKDSGASTLSALRGQRIRVLAPLVMTPLLKAWGLNPTPVDPTQVLQSMSTGLIDGVFDPPTPITDQGWDTYGKSYVEMDAVFNVDPLVMSSKVFDGLSKPEQQAVTAAFKKTLTTADEDIKKETDDAVAKMKQKGIGIYTPPKAAFEQAAKQAEPAWDRTFGADVIKQVRAVAKAQG